MPRGPHIVLYPCGACGKRGAYVWPCGDGIMAARCRACKAQRHWSRYLHDVTDWRPEHFAAQLRAMPAEADTTRRGARGA